MMNVSGPMVVFVANKEGEGDGDTKTPGMQPYMCIAHYWTIGFGHVIFHKGRALRYEADRDLAYELFPALTRTEAVELMKADLALCVKVVNECTAGVPTTQPQFDAMCSLCFNIGEANFRKSTLVRTHRKQMTQPAKQDPLTLIRQAKSKTLPGNAPDQFMAWSFVKGGKEWSQGLANRRGEERTWYLKAA